MALDGQQVFREKCASCHQAHGLGHAVGPDLSAEFQRAEETILRDVLAPSDTISPGYVTYSVATDGRSGVQRPVGRRIAHEPHLATGRGQGAGHPPQGRG